MQAVAAQQVGQVLREGGARHDCVASSFDSLGLQIALQVREEADDRCALFQLCLQLGNQRQRLGIGIVQIEDNQTRTICLLTRRERRDGIFLVLDEGDLHAEFARGLRDLGVEEEIFNKEKYLRGCIFRDGNRAANGVVDRLRVADIRASAATSALVVTVRFDCGRRRIGEVAIDYPIAVVHWADKAPRPTLLLALALEACAAVSRLMTIGVAISRAVAIAGCASLVARVLGRALPVAIAELLLPSLGRRSRAVLLLAGACLEILRRPRGGITLATLNVAHVLRRGTLTSVGRLVLPFAAAPAAALRLPHAVLYVVCGILRLAVLTHLAIHLRGRRWRTLVLLHLGYILL